MALLISIIGGVGADTEAAVCLPHGESENLVVGGRKGV